MCDPWMLFVIEALVPLMSYLYLTNLNIMPYVGRSFVGNLRAASVGELREREAAMAVAGRLLSVVVSDGILARLLLEWHRFNLSMNETARDSKRQQETHRDSKRRTETDRDTSECIIRFWALQEIVEMTTDISKIDLRPMTDQELVLYEKSIRRLRGKVGKRIRQKQDEASATVKANRKNKRDEV